MPCAFPSEIHFDSFRPPVKWYLGLGLGVWGLGFRARGLGVSGFSGFRVQGLGHAL